MLIAHDVEQISDTSTRNSGEGISMRSEQAGRIIVVEVRKNVVCAQPQRRIDCIGILPAHLHIGRPDLRHVLNRSAPVIIGDTIFALATKFALTVLVVPIERHCRVYPHGIEIDYLKRGDQPTGSRY